MKKINFKLKLTFNLLGVVLLIGFTSITLVLAQESVKESKIPAIHKPKNGTRIVISTSGPAKISSHWLDNPPRLVVEFKTKNVTSKIGSELLVNEGGIKRIMSEYYSGQNKILKSLTFELQEKVPYKIWQEADTILLDIQTPQELSVFLKEGREIFAKNETKDAIIKRLEAMDVALKQVVTQMPSKTPKSELTKLVREFPKDKRRGKMGSMSWFIGLILIAGLGFLLRQREDILIKTKQFFSELRKFLNRSLSNLGNFWQRIRLTDNKDGKPTPSEKSNVEKTLPQEAPILKKPLFIARIKILAEMFKGKFKFKNRKKDILSAEIERLKFELKQRNKLLEQEEIIRKAIEDASRTREKESEHLKLELQNEAKLLEQEERARKTAEEGLSQKEKEVAEVKGSLESLKEVLVEKGLAKKLTTTEKDGELWISGKSAERRELPRLDLTKDYNRTIILRIESQDKTKSIKSFANNISLGGICFDTRSDFKEKDRINLRLFFFGDRVPMMKFQAKAIWRKIESPVNRYGVSFSQLEEKNKIELNRYIESKIARS